MDPSGADLLKIAVGRYGKPVTGDGLLEPHEVFIVK